LGQLSASYIIAEGPDGLYLIDQHAAHERILFEKINRQTSLQDTDVQGLLEPTIFEVSLRQDSLLKNRYQNLSHFGFTIEPFGERSYLVRAVPALLHGKDWSAALRELFDSPAGTDWTEKIAVSVACHSAIRAGQVLSDNEMRQLLRQLEQVSLPNTCPHGRPTIIHLTSKQLEKEFGRA
jgi:DNA mismatch repair protein MutL